MSLVYLDAVCETTTTTGTGPLTLLGAVTSYFPFTAVGNGNTCYYDAWAVDSDGVPTGDREIGLGTWATGGVLTRTSVIRSSNSNNAVSFSAGTKRVALTSPALFFTAGGLPGGSDGQVQFDDAGAFGGDAGLTYNKTTDTLTSVILIGSTKVRTPLIDTASGDLTLSPASGVTNLSGQYGCGNKDAGNSGSAATLNWNDGNVQTLTMTADCTLTLSNPVVGRRYVLILVQDGTGNWQITWPAAVKWPAGHPSPVLSGASKTDLISLVYDGTYYYGNAAFNY